MTSQELQTLLDGTNADKETRIAMITVAMANDLLSIGEWEAITEQNKLDSMTILNVSYGIEQGRVKPHQIVDAYYKSAKD